MAKWKSNLVSKKKYEKGDNPCGNCQSSRHEKCRPRLDGTLCSCACEWAAGQRFAHEDECLLAKAAGRPEPTIAESMAPFYPRVVKRFA